MSGSLTGCSQGRRCRWLRQESLSRSLPRTPDTRLRRALAWMCLPEREHIRQRKALGLKVIKKKKKISDEC